MPPPTDSRTSLADAGRGAVIDGGGNLAGDEIGLCGVETDIAQPLRDRKFLQHRGDRGRRIVAAERVLQARLGLGRRFEIKAHDMRQHDCVGLGVRQAEAAEHVRQLVVQRGAGAEHGSGEPGADETLAARRDIGAVGDHRRQVLPKPPHRLGGEPDRHRRAAIDPQRLDAMGDGVHAACGADRGRQAEREIGIVDDGARHDLDVAAGDFALAVGHAENRRSFRAGIGRRQGEDRQAGLERDRFGKTDGGAAAHRDQTVGLFLACRREPCFGDRLRHMHHRLRMQDRRARTEKLADFLAEPRAAARRCDDQRAVDFQPRRLIGNARQRTGSKDNALRRNVVSEGDRLHFPSRQMPSAFCAGRSEIENSTDSLGALWW